MNGLLYRKVRHLELNCKQYLVTKALTVKPATAHELAQSCGLSRASTVRLLNILRDQHVVAVVKKQIKDDNRRRRVIHLYSLKPSTLNINEVLNAQYL